MEQFTAEEAKKLVADYVTEHQEEEFQKILKIVLDAIRKCASEGKTLLKIEKNHTIDPSLLFTYSVMNSPCGITNLGKNLIYELNQLCFTLDVYPNEHNLTIKW